MKDTTRNEPEVPAVVDRGTFQAELDALRVREKAHTREGDAIAAARRRLPMVEVDGAAGDVGGLAHRLAATVGRQAAYAYRRASNVAVVAAEGRTFRRSGHRQPLTSSRTTATGNARARVADLVAVVRPGA